MLSDKSREKDNKLSVYYKMTGTAVIKCLRFSKCARSREVQTVCAAVRSDPGPLALPLSQASGPGGHLSSLTASILVRFSQCQLAV